MFKRGVLTSSSQALDVQKEAFSKYMPLSIHSSSSEACAVNAGAACGDVLSGDLCGCSICKLP